jgi:glycerophosphoryl diester phosphodiesterase
MKFKKCFTLGHRGIGAYILKDFPENTLKSFKEAYKFVDYCECDVRLTKDSKVIVFHDETLDRTTNGKGKVEDFTYNELLKLKVGDNEKIPLIEELLEFLKENPNKNLFIELKGENTEEKLIELINNYKLTNQINIISFNIDWLKKIRNIDKNISIGILVRDIKNEEEIKLIKKDYENLLADNIGINYRIVSKDLVKIFNNLWVWNPRNKEDIKNVCEIGVIGMGSNNLKITINSIKEFYKN